MDAVYVLGRGSTWQDNELRYSLRALAEFVDGVDRVVVVGHRPPWLQNVLHVPHPDRHTCKERNIMEKILVACALPDLSPEFLFLNDDHLALLPQSARVPYWRGGHLWDVAERLGHTNRYAQAVRNTHHFLSAVCASTWNFDVHAPIVYDKELFPKVMALVNWDAGCFVIKSLYANFVEVPHEWLPDLKLGRGYQMRELATVLKGRPWWSHGPQALNFNLQNLLAALYPQKSKFEI